MLPSGRGAGRALGAPVAHRYLPPTFHQNAPPLGELVVLPSPSLYETLCQGSPLSRPTPLSSLPAPRGLILGREASFAAPVWNSALAEAARKGWNFSVLPGGGHSRCQPPLWGTSEMAVLNTAPQTGPPPPQCPRHGSQGWRLSLVNGPPASPTLPWG